MKVKFSTSSNEKLKISKAHFYYVSHKSYYPILEGNIHILVGSSLHHTRIDINGCYFVVPELDFQVYN